MSLDKISVDFQKLDEESKELSDCADSISEIRKELLRVTDSIKNMSYGKLLNEIHTRLNQNAALLNELSEEEYGLSHKLALIREAYCQIELEVCKITETISFNDKVTQRNNSSFISVQPLAFPTIESVYRGNTIKNEEWLDDLLNDFSLYSRKDNK